MDRNNEIISDDAEKKLEYIMQLYRPYFPSSTFQIFLSISIQWNSVLRNSNIFLSHRTIAFLYIYKLSIKSVFFLIQVLQEMLQDMES